MEWEWNLPLHATHDRRVAPLTARPQTFLERETEFRYLLLAGFGSEKLNSIRFWELQESIKNYTADNHKSLHRERKENQQLVMLQICDYETGMLEDLLVTSRNCYEISRTAGNICELLESFEKC